MSIKASTIILLLTTLDMLMSIEIDKSRYKSIASTEPYWKVRISYAEVFRYDFGIKFVTPASQNFTVRQSYNKLITCSLRDIRQKLAEIVWRDVEVL